jgi:hypothetical protein
LAAHIARRIAEVPSIIDRAVEWIDQREWEEPAPSKRELEEWRSVLTTLSPRQVVASLMEEFERADRLRQLLPFVDVLTSEDRAAVFREASPSSLPRCRPIGSNEPCLFLDEERGRAPVTAWKDMIWQRASWSRSET